MNEILSLTTCSCHVLDPNKFPILVWMRNNQLIVKVANQHFIGLSRTDKKGETYWKCKDFAEQVNNSQLNNENGKPTNSPISNNSE